MKFLSMYNQVIPLWGSEIDISDFKVEMVTSREPNGEICKWQSKSSQNLTQKWNEVEKIIGVDVPHTDLMVWTMYQIFLEAAEGLFIQNKFKLYPKEVDIVNLEQLYSSNLSAKGWEKELGHYINDLTDPP